MTIFFTYNVTIATLQPLRNTLNFSFMCQKLKNEFSDPRFFIIKLKSAYQDTSFCKVLKKICISGSEPPYDNKPHIFMRFKCGSSGCNGPSVMRQMVTYIHTYIALFVNAGWQIGSQRLMWTCLYNYNILGFKIQIKLVNK